MAGRKRDNAYYLGLVERRDPGIFARYRAGDMTAAEAIRAAGVKTPPKAIHALRRAWKAASAADRTIFAAEVGLVPAGAVTGPLSTPTAVTVTICNPDGRLTRDGARRIQEIMDKRGITTGGIMKEIGLDPLDASLGQALRHSSRIKQALAEAVQVWVDRH